MEMVNIYWNSRRRLWSILQRGKVIGYDPSLMLTDCRLVVSQAGRQRTVAMGRKVIHAFVRGKIVGVTKSIDSSWIRIRYNPFEVSTFVTADGGKPVYSAAAVVMCADGKVFAKEPGYVKV